MLQISSYLKKEKIVVLFNTKRKKKSWTITEVTNTLQLKSPFKIVFLTFRHQPSHKDWPLNRISVFLLILK